ncbi:MAG: penicillin-binding protein 2, partial [Bdellovibrionales bacterium]|nr:penicillin-binding protein 2 [Bdellovibrionales bacterium]
FALGSRLWYLQCLQGSYYRDLSENNRIRTIRTQAPRGIIYDRYGRVIVRNRPAFQIALMLEDTPDVPATIERIARLTDREPERLQRAFESERRSMRFEPKVVLHDVSREDLARVKVNTHNLPGLIVSTIPTRSYPHGSLASQLVGFTREISKSQLDAEQEHGYHMGDIVGQTGLEREFESALRGEAGYTQVEVDARGARRAELGIVDHRQGANLYLTLDLDVQQAAEKALGDRRGAVVAIDPRNGEVLALASTPAFDVNMFSGPVAASDWNDLVKDIDRPLSNRGISSIYPPGSTMKLLWAVAGLAEGKITPKTRLPCPGYFWFGGRRYHCHKTGGHGAVNLQEAIMLSCNAFFYQLGHQLEIDTMSKYLDWFGQLSGISLSGEQTATGPSRQWKLERFGERWYPGDTIPVAIGQGYLTVTPIQLARMVAGIASDGKMYRPMLVRKVVNPETGEMHEFQPELQRQLPIDPEVFRLVREYAATVVNEPRGTGKRSALNGVTVAGKTGTAQVAALGKAGDNERLNHHAWFVAFAPAEAPEIALSVIVENAGGGGLNAAPVAHDVLEVYFRKRGMLEEETEGIEGKGEQQVATVRETATEEPQGDVPPPPDEGESPSPAAAQSPGNAPIATERGATEGGATDAGATGEAPSTPAPLPKAPAVVSFGARP